MHSRLLLCLCVLGVVSAADEQTQGHDPDFNTSQNGSTFDSIFEASVASNSVEVLPNGSESLQYPEISGSSKNSISFPNVVKEISPFLRNVNQPIPVPVYSSNKTTHIEEYSNPRTSDIPPITDFFKIPNEFYPSPTTNPSSIDLQSNYNLGNPYKEVSSSFRLWPKLPEPIPVPVLTASSFVKDSYKKLNTNLVPQYQQKVQVPVKVYPSIIKKYQQDLAPVQYPNNLPIQGQTFQPQPANQGSIYFLVPGNNNQPGASSSPTQGPYPQASQGNQGLIILAPPISQQPVSNQAYQNNGYSSNQAYFGNQPQRPYDGFSNLSPLAQPYAQSGQPTSSVGQVPFNIPIAPFNGSQAGNTGGQPPVNFVLLTPPNSQGNQALNNAGGQPPLIYAALPPSNSQGSQSANLANQPPFNFAVVAPLNGPGSPTQISSSDQQNSYKHALFGTGYAPQNANAHKNVNVVIIPPTNSGQSLGAPNAPGQVPYALYSSNVQGGVNNPALAPSPQQNVGYSSTPSPLQQVGYSPQSPPQNGYSFTPTPQSFGYSSTPAPPQYVAYSNNGYSPSQAPLQSAGYSSTPAPPQYASYPASQQAPQQYPGNLPTQGLPQFAGYSPTQAPLQFAGFSPTQAPPQNFNNPPAQSPPQYAVYSSTQAPPQFPGYSSTQAPPQYASYSPSQAPPQFAGYSSTPTPSQFGYSSSPAPQYAGYSSSQTPQNFGFTSASTAQPGFSQQPVSTVNFSTPGSSYSYSVK